MNVILLAAGASTRTTTPKPLYIIEQKCWLEAQLKTLSKIPIHEVTLVLGYHFNEIQTALPWVKNKKHKIENTKINICINENPQRGTFSSIQEGLKFGAIKDDIFILPLDCPVPSAQVWTSLKSNLLNHDAIKPQHNLKGGHPLLLSKKVIDKILDLEDTSRLDHALHSLDVFRLETDDLRVCLNLNTDEAFADYQKSLVF